MLVRQRRAIAVGQLEIAEFRKLGRPNDIAVMHVAGDGPTIRHDTFAGLTPIEHDVRRGWFGWFLKSKARIELLRLIAFLTGVEMRQLHNWARRRQLRNVVIGVVAALAPVIGVLSITQPHWESVASNLTFDEAPMQPLACEVIDDKLWVAAWSKAAGEVSGARDYFVTYPNALADPFAVVARPRHFKLARRALPERLVNPDVMKQAAEILGSRDVVDKLAQRLSRATSFASRSHGRIGSCSSNPSRFLRARLRTRRQSTTVFGAGVRRLLDRDPRRIRGKDHEGGRPVATAVERPEHKQTEHFAGSRDLDNLARQRRDLDRCQGRARRQSARRLVAQPGRRRSWTKIHEFVSVTSLDLAASIDGKETLLVAEDNFERLHTSSNVPGSARIMERADGDHWIPASAPPHGSDSEIEICGTMPDGALYIRVGGAIYQNRTRSLLRSVLEGS